MEYSNILRHHQTEVLNRLLPDVVCLAILAVVGALGNILAAMFYKTSFKRTTTLNLIIVLTFNDFVVCLLFIPNIIEIDLNVTYRYSTLCKITHLLNQWCVGTSCILLLVISIDRYRRICKPFGKQISSRALKYVIPCVLFVSFCMALRKIVDYDTIEIDIKTSDSNSNISGKYCTNTNDPELYGLVSAFYVIDVIFASITWLTIIVAYSNAINTLIKQKQKKKQQSRMAHLQTISRGLTLEGSERHPTSEQNVIFGCANQIYGMDIYDEQLSYDLDENDGNNITASTDSVQNKNMDTMGTGSANNHSVNTHDIRYFTNPIQNENKVRKFRKKPIVKNISALEQSLTYMMFTASAVFLLSFSPFFIIKLYLINHPERVDEYELRAGVQFALKLPLVNSVFTPIIYCMFNSKFRQFLKPKCCKFFKIAR